MQTMRLNLFFAAAIVSVASSTTLRLAAQDNYVAPSLEQRVSDPVYVSWVSQPKVALCVSCHYQGPNAASVLGGLGSSDFSRQRELDYWLSHDKHTIARRRVEPYREEQEEAELAAMLGRLEESKEKLVEFYRQSGASFDPTKVGLKKLPEDWIGESNLLSRRICDKLGFDVSTESGYEQFRDQCLTCHGGYQKDDTGFTLANKGNEQVGIDCMYCHQQGTNPQWVQDHQKDALPNPDKWRLLPAEVKEAAGMRDLVKTSAQASLCLDCHVGNRQKNMFVTHEMYAAGHPPLPSVELQTFCTAMPQHWQTSSQLHDSLSDYPGRDAYFQTNFPGVVGPGTSAGDTFWNTRQMLIGALAARKKSLQIVIDSAAAHPWADYSLYDCASCHHELQSDSRRQQRGFPGAPGRPRQPEWPEPLLLIAYRLFGGPGEEGQQRYQSMLQLEQNLTRDFADQPFGNPERVRSSAEALQAEIDKAIAKVEALPINARTARGVLGMLSRTPIEQMLTYDASRQVVWALQVIAGELESHNQVLPPGVSEVIRSLGEPAASGVEAGLPSGRSQFIYPVGLQQDLELRAQFDPERLETQLRQLQTLLSDAAALRPSPQDFAAESADQATAE
jgi:hypothetical protein